MEFTSFQRMVSWQMYHDLDRAPTADVAKAWLFTQMEKMDETIKEKVHGHKFPHPPPLQWLSDYLPQLNQSVLMATAVPAVVVDLSTVANRQFRYPIKWAEFGQYRPNIDITLNPLPISHPTLIMQHAEY